MNANRLPFDEMLPNDDLILQMLAEATISRIDKSKPSFMFHSAGKDSNSIALALAEAGWNNKVTLMTYKSKGKKDESEISARIAKKLGFQHQILHVVDQLQSKHHQAIENYFINAPFPSTDKVTLAYPLYAQQQPELKGANIIDGMGNDVFIGHIPNKSEYKRQQLSTYLKHSRMISKNFPSGSIFHVMGKTRAEWTGLTGLSFSDTKKILPHTFDVSDYWLAKDTKQDYLDFRASIRGTIIDQEIYTRKARNFADSINANMVLPWANEKIAEYFSIMPEEHLFDRKTLKNKLILRKILSDRKIVDSDALGKMGFSYDWRSIVLKNWDMILKEITECRLWNQTCPFWNQTDLNKFLYRIKTLMDYNATPVGVSLSARFVYRIYLLSAWINHSKYVR
jgi:asparagine synthase (glutamine-hydrolysing)